jgi:hypothetical protein
MKWDEIEEREIREWKKQELNMAAWWNDRIETGPQSYLSVVQKICGWKKAYKINTLFCVCIKRIKSEGIQFYELVTNIRYYSNILLV